MNLNLIARIFGWNKSEEPKPLECPYCSGTDWYEGPSGGLSTNIMCANPECEHWFNYHQGWFPMDDLHKTGWR